MDNMKHHFKSVQEIITSLNERSDFEILTVFERDSTKTWNGIQQQAAVATVRSRLLKSGVKSGDRVLLYAPNSAWWIFSCLAVLDAGCLLVPVDAQLSSDDLVHVLKDADPSIILTTIAGQRLISQLLPDGGYPFILIEELDEHQLKPEVCSTNSAVVTTTRPDDTIAIFYTSGTSGKPKGVPLSDRNIVYQINSAIDTEIISSADRVLQPLPLHHIYPFTLGMLTPLAIGAPIVLPHELTGPELLRAIKEGRSTVLVGVPRLFNGLNLGLNKRLNSLGPFRSFVVNGILKFCDLVRTCGGPLLGKTLLKPIHSSIGPDLRLLTTGGAHLETALLKKLESLGWRVAVGYGLTETSPLITFKMPDDISSKGVGKILPGTELIIHSDPNSSIVEVPEQAINQTVGEIMVRGPGVFRGYRHLPELSKTVLEEDGWFHTGDFGYLKDGSLHVLGRSTSLIVTESGKKIDPEVLEGHYRQNPLIDEIAIMERFGKLVAIVVPRMEQVRQLDADLNRLIHDAIDAGSINLPTYKRLSGYTITNQPLPKTAIGKIQRHKLQNQYEQLLTGPSALDSSDSSTAQAELEEEVLKDPIALKTWEYLQKRYQDRSPRLQSSLQLDLGIDSLEWIDLTMDIEDLADLRLRQESLSKVKTVSDLLVEIVFQKSLPRIEKTGELLETVSDSDLKSLKPLTTIESTATFVLHSMIFVVMKLFFGIRVRGLENLSSDGNFIFAPNHASYIDAFAFGAALPYRFLSNTYWAAWTGIAFANPLVRSLSRIGRLIPIDADHALLSSIALAIAVLKRHKNLVWFPEGRRTLTGDLITFRPGIGVLMQHSSIPVVPVYLQGTAQALPAGSWLVRPTLITVVFGKPEHLEDLCETSELTPEKIASAIRDRVQGLRKNLEDETSQLVKFDHKHSQEQTLHL